MEICKSVSRDGLARLEALVVGPQAAGAHIDLLALPIDGDRHFLYIGQPGTICAPFGVAYIMSELWALAANITLGHLSNPFLESGYPLSARRICHTCTEYDTIDEFYTQNRQ